MGLSGIADKLGSTGVVMKFALFFVIAVSNFPISGFAQDIIQNPSFNAIRNPNSPIAKLTQLINERAVSGKEVTIEELHRNKSFLWVNAEMVNEINGAIRQKRQNTISKQFQGNLNRKTPLNFDYASVGMTRIAEVWEVNPFVKAEKEREDKFRKMASGLDSKSKLIPCAQAMNLSKESTNESDGPIFIRDGGAKGMFVFDSKGEISTCPANEVKAFSNGAYRSYQVEDVQVKGFDASRVVKAVGESKSVVEKICTSEGNSSTGTIDSKMALVSALQLHATELVRRQERDSECVKLLERLEKDIPVESALLPTKCGARTDLNAVREELSKTRQAIHGAVTSCGGIGSIHDTVLPHYFREDLYKDTPVPAAQQQ